MTYYEKMGVVIVYSFEKSADFEVNLGPGKTHPGIPKCIFRGKEVPKLVVPTPKGSITSKILADILNIVDNLGVSPENMEI